MRRTTEFLPLGALALGAALALPALPAAAQQAFPMPGQPDRATIGRAGAPMAIEAGTGRILTLPRQAGTVFAADPRVAEVRPASPTSLFVFGVAPGRTTVAALDGNGAPVAQVEVTVTPSGYAAGMGQGQVQRALPGRDVRVDTRGNGVELRGEVMTPAEASRAAAIARSYLGEGQTLDNRLGVQSQTQVNLRVRIAEVGREVTRQFGINWQALGSIGRFAIAAATNTTLADPTNLGSFISGAYSGVVDVNGIIDALAAERLISILAEPNLTAMSGQTASFLAGGEFPVPVAQRDFTVTIEFKQYGVSLAFVPTVLSNGRINLRVRPEVSELTEQGAVRLSANNSSIQIPALTVRRAETSVELGSGQSFAIAGLLQDNTRTIGRALPILGETPVLGALFRSDRFQRNETELVIVVTPYIVGATSQPVAMRTPLDGMVPANDLERVLLFRQYARRQTGTPPQIPGEAGFAIR
jgi:pilus assembly protein CpaC